MYELQICILWTFCKLFWKYVSYQEKNIAEFSKNLQVTGIYEQNKTLSLYKIKSTSTYRKSSILICSNKATELQALYA